MRDSSRVLLAHEWLEPTGGSENTFEQMIEVFPAARVACLWNNAPHRFPHAEESWLSRTPIRQSKAASLAFMRSAWKRVDLSDVETVVASSHAMSHHLAGIAASQGIDAYAYVYSPPRYIWAADLDARGQNGVATVARPVARHLDLRGLDSRVRYCGISRFVAERMHRSWGVEAEVVYPPVDTERICSVSDWSTKVSSAESEMLARLPEAFVLGASRLIAYKRLDVAMRVGEELSLPVVIAGDGPHLGALRSEAERKSVPVQFVGRVSDEALYALYQRAQLFVFMPVEDFGIMPIEAMALGTRTLVRDTGGTREVAGELGAGVWVDPENSSALRAAAVAALEQPAPNGASVAATFSHSRFRADFGRYVDS